ncbi:MAG: YHS domain-containing protein [Chlamydiales bacterium]|jgi:YHS domain-containing protein
MVARYDIDLRGYFDSERVALLDKDHFIRMNYEAFFFADSAGADRFRSNQVAYCGLLTDPVSKQRFRPTPGDRSERHEGVEFYFESEETRKLFARMPESYSLPGYKTNPKSKKAAGEKQTPAKPAGQESSAASEVAPEDAKPAS